MDTFFSALLCIFAGGVVPFSLTGNVKVMKFLVIFLMGCGCVLGLYSTLNRFFLPEAVTAVWPLPHILVLALKVDLLSACFLLPIFIISGLAVLYSYHYLDHKQSGRRIATHYFFYALLVVAMALVACADNIPTFALAWELMSLASFFLVIFDFEKSTVRKAGYLYFIFAQAGAMFIFGSFAVVYSSTGSLDFISFASVPVTIKALIFTLAFIGFGSKAGIVPLHVWLPYAHPAAPSHVSAVMSGVMIKMGIYGILRMYMLLQPPGYYCAELVITVGAITGVLGVVYALGQHNLKQLLAYHSVENIGIILLGLGLGMLGVAIDNQPMAILGFAGGLLHVLNHALFKSLLFMGAGAVQQSTGTLAIEQLGGLMKRMRICGVTFLIGSLAICGLPPFNGFISEFLIYRSGFYGVTGTSEPFLFVVLAILSLAIIGGLAIACFTKVLGVVFLGEPRSAGAAKALPAGASMQTVMIILALICTFTGLVPQLVMPLVLPVALFLLPHQALSYDVPMNVMVNHLSFAALGFSLFVGLIIVLRKILTRGEASSSTTWGCGFSQPSSRMQYSGSSFAASLLAFYKPFVQVHEKKTTIHGFFPKTAHYYSQVHDGSEVGLQWGLVRPLLSLTAKLRWLQHGHTQIYIGYLFFTVCGLLLWVVLR